MQAREVELKLEEAVRQVENVIEKARETLMKIVIERLNEIGKQMVF